MPYTLPPTSPFLATELKAARSCSDEINEVGDVHAPDRPGFPLFGGSISGRRRSDVRTRARRVFPFRLAPRGPFQYALPGPPRWPSGDRARGWLRSRARGEHPHAGARTLLR